MLRLLKPSRTVFLTGITVLVITGVFLLEGGSFYEPTLKHYYHRTGITGVTTPSSTSLRQLLDHDLRDRTDLAQVNPYLVRQDQPETVTDQKQRMFQPIASERNFTNANTHSHAYIVHLPSARNTSESPDTNLKITLLPDQSDRGDKEELIIEDYEPTTSATSAATTTDDLSYNDFDPQLQQKDLTSHTQINMLHKLSPNSVLKNIQSDDNLNLPDKTSSINDFKLEKNSSHIEMFKIRQPFHLPFPSATLSVGELLEKDWIKNLQQYLSQLPPGVGPVGVVTSDFKYRDVLINWLINALVKVDSPVTNVVVFSLDEPLREMLQTHGIFSIYVPPQDFMNPHLHLTRHIPFTQVMVMRFTLMRLLTHWGFDAINYDSDAIILKNLGPVFHQHQDSDVIASPGKYPKEVKAEWGITACAGLWMIRSSQRSELFWEVMSPLLPKSLNDQAKLNVALIYLNVLWGSEARKNNLREAWTGRGKQNFTVTILPAMVVCRQACTKKMRALYYVWHKGGISSAGKAHYASQGGVWNVRRDWEDVVSDAVGVKWLEAVSVTVAEKQPRKH